MLKINIESKTKLGIITFIFLLGIWLGCIIMYSSKQDLLKEIEKQDIEISTYRNVINQIKEREEK